MQQAPSSVRTRSTVIPMPVEWAWARRQKAVAVSFFSSAGISLQARRELSSTAVRIHWLLTPDLALRPARRPSTL
ncbi:hypothetical protein [Streptomyces parvus]|uniref:hypothetical protein n=1 Tax=Streptomyces parvus TaxID=66428 RepID=UPI003721D05F